MDLLAIPGTDINLVDLDTVVRCLYHQDNQISHEDANSILMSFIKRDDAYKCVKDVLGSEFSSGTKYIALTALLDAVKFRWLSLPNDFKEEIKQYINIFIDNYIENNGEQSHISEANLILVEIAKYDFPERWPSFLSDLLQMSHKSQNHCKNVFSILSTLADEVEECFENSLTSVRSQEMKEELEKYIDSIINLIQETFETNNTSLIQSSLATLGRLVTYLNPEVLLQSSLLNELLTKYLLNSDLCVAVIGVITNIVSMEDIPEELYPFLGQLFDLIVGKLSSSIGNSFIEAQKLSGDDEFVEYFVTAIIEFLQQYYTIVEVEEHEQNLKILLDWLLDITDSKTDIFEDLLEYWVQILRRIYINITQKINLEVTPIYVELFPYLRQILINRMPSPHQSTSFCESDGTEHRRLISGHGFGSQYSNAREILVFITNLDTQATLLAFKERHSEFTNGTLDPNGILSMSYAYGAVAGAIVSEIEDELNPSFFEPYLRIMTEDTEHGELFKAAAIGFMFMCTQYTDFLKRNTEYFVMTFTKIIESMQYDIIEIQEYAVDTLKKIGCRCKDEFYTATGDMTLITSIIEQTEIIIHPLFSDFVPPMFEFIGIVVLAAPVESRHELSNQIMEFLVQKMNEAWEKISQNDFESYEDFFVIIGCIDKTVAYLHEFIPDLIKQSAQFFINYYQRFSDLIKQFYADPRVDYWRETAASMRIRSILLSYLCLLCHVIRDDVFASEFLISNVLIYVLDEFSSSLSCFRVPKVFEYCSNIIKYYGNLVAPYLDEILNKLYRPVVSIVGDELNEIPEFRDSFLTFMRHLCLDSPRFIAMIPEEDQDSFIECLKWGCNHPMSNTNEIAIRAMNELINGLSRIGGEIFEQFCERNAMDLMLFAFQVLADTSTKSSFRYQVMLIKTIVNLQIIKQQAIELGSSLCQMFPTETPSEIGDILTVLFNENTPDEEFRNCLKNFLVSVRQISSMDPDLIIIEMDEMKKNLKHQFEDVPGFIDFTSESMEESAVSHIANELASLHF
ncbi:nuclear export signal receptor protein [Trichomonas vaginalis G3]|nr:nuclear export signal receptor protein [Trichomonas vaginalis G3]KAI5532118.1 nuclear export signal receptor protein [Trichomonas vaginalis G3]